MLLEMILYFAIMISSQRNSHTVYIVYYRSPEAILPQKVQIIAHYFNASIFRSASMNNSMSRHGPPHKHFSGHLQVKY